MSGSYLLPWDRFSEWVHCICVVTFDLELGQALEVVYPAHAVLTEGEKMNICYLAFPDSNSGCMGDTIFHFRMRRFSSVKPRKPGHMLYNKTIPNHLQVEFGYYYGFVYFRQVMDKTIPRGYFQKSVVVLTQLPLIRLFHHVVQIIAPEYFENGEPGLEAGCHDIDQWANPVPGATLNLPLMGRLFQARIPTRFDHPNANFKVLQTNGNNPSSLSLLSVHEPPLYESLKGILYHVQLLWELIILGEPLVVMGTSPTLCSNTVSSLISLIWPLQYAQDFRPFFTIHDSEFKEYTSRTQPPPNVVLGVTNPFFSKTLHHWPHLVKLADQTSGGRVGSKAAGESKVINKGMGSDTKGKLDKKPGMYTQYKTYLVRDKLILKRLEKGMESNRPDEVQSAMLRKYFIELTESFMIPLERYVASLMPLQKQISPFKSAPQPRKFDFNEFLSILDMNGPNLTSQVKGNWVGLYRAFVGTGNFKKWLEGRMAEVNYKLELLHLDVLVATQFTAHQLQQEHHEIQIVDFLLKLRHKQDFISKEKQTEKNLEYLRQLNEQMDTVMDALSPDLRVSLLLPTTLSSDAQSSATTGRQTSNSTPSQPSSAILAPTPSLTVSRSSAELLNPNTSTTTPFVGGNRQILLDSGSSSAAAQQSGTSIATGHHSRVPVSVDNIDPLNGVEGQTMNSSNGEEMIPTGGLPLNSMCILSADNLQQNPADDS